MKSTRSAHDQRQLALTLRYFLDLRRWEEKQQIVEQHPELLEPQAEVLLEGLKDAQESAEAIQLVQEHQKLLQRCRDAGIPRAFAEKQLSTEGIAEAARRGLQPEEFLAQLRAVQEKPPELREVLAELAAAGIEVSTSEELDQILQLSGTLRYFLSLDRWDEKQRMVEQHPELLSPEAELLLGRLRLDQESTEAIALVQEHQELLRCCLDAGVSGAFAEKQLSTEGIAEATRRRLQLEEFLAQLRVAKEMPPELREILADLSAEGIEVHTPEELAQIVPVRPDLVARLGRVVQAVEFGPPALPEIADDQRAAEMALEHYLSSGDLSALDSAAAAWSRILEHRALSSAAEGTRGLVFNNAGNIFLHRHKVYGRAADLDCAVELLKRAVHAFPSDYPDMPMSLSNLGTALRHRFMASGRESDLEESIRVCEQAVRAVRPGSPHLSQCLNSLGNGLRDRFALRGCEEDLERAIGFFQEALNKAPIHSPVRSSYLSNLAIGLADRFAYAGGVADLDEAIRLYREAVRTTTEGSPDLPMFLNNLGNSLRTRFNHMHTSEQSYVSDLEEAIRVYKLAVQATPSGSPNLATYLSNLGTGLTLRSTITVWEEDLDEAIQICRQAVLATPSESSELPLRLCNLGNCLEVRGERTGQAADLDEAIRVLQQSVQASPPESTGLCRYLANLGNAFTGRFNCTKEAADFEEASKAYRRACQLGVLDEPQVALKAASVWGDKAMQHKDWNDTAEAYGYGLAAGRELLVQQLLRKHKENWLRHLEEMSGRAAYALSKLDRFEEAATTMERGRARLLAEALQRRRRDLQQLPAQGRADLYERYRQIVQEQDRLTQSEPTQLGALRGPERHDAIIAAARDFELVVADIRKVPGYADFLGEANFAQIQAADSDTPVVYLLATSAGGIALIVQAHAIKPVWLDSLTDGAIREWLRGPADDPTAGGWLNVYRIWVIEGTQQAQQAWLAAMDDITHQLWVHVMQPLAQALHQVKTLAESFDAPQVTLIPAGLLALLPLHAAWTEDACMPTGRHYFLDEFTVNYAPSALALSHARERAELEPDDRLLAIEEPLAAGASNLPNVQREVAAIAGLFDNPVILSHEKATRQAVLAALPQADVVHFSCHGSNDWQAPLESGLLMADDETGQNAMLTVRDLLESEHVGGRLATLSACETGIVGTDLPDEVVALPSALLQAGYGGVAASLWSVADISTAMLMEYFYAGWRKKEGDKLSPAQALRAAQRWVRDTTNREKADYFKRYSNELSGNRMPEATAVDFFTQMMMMSRNLESRDFAHPFWWAAFYLTGA